MRVRVRFFSHIRFAHTRTHKHTHTHIYTYRYIQVIDGEVTLTVKDTIVEAPCLSRMYVLIVNGIFALYVAGSCYGYGVNVYKSVCVCVNV